MAIICSKCSKTARVYSMCNRETEGQCYCDKCFNTHPCGRGRHGEACPVRVFDENPEVKDSTRKTALRQAAKLCDDVARGLNRDDEKRCRLVADQLAEGIRALEQEGVDDAEEQVRSAVIRASEHPSSERRRGLEEAAKICEDVKNNGPVVTSTCWHAVASQLDHAAARIRALISPSSEGGEEKTDPIREEMARALEECVHLMHADTPSDGWKDAIDAGRAALSKHRDHPPAVASGGSRR